MIQKKVHANAGKRVSHLVFLPERPKEVLNNDRVEFMEGDTRMYRMGIKTYDADTYDKMFGIKNKKAEILPKGTKDPHYFNAGSLKPTWQTGTIKARRHKY